MCLRCWLIPLRYRKLMTSSPPDGSSHSLRLKTVESPDAFLENIKLCIYNISIRQCFKISWRSNCTSTAVHLRHTDSCRGTMWNKERAAPWVSPASGWSLLAVLTLCRPSAEPEWAPAPTWQPYSSLWTPGVQHDAPAQRRTTGERTPARLAQEQAHNSFSVYSEVQR